MKFDGMTTEGGLALMDIALNRLRERRSGEIYTEFGTYKGRTAALIAQNIGADDWLHAVESKDYLEVDRLMRLSDRFSWHKAKSEDFCTKDLAEVLSGKKIAFSHHDASHFFDNVTTELRSSLESMDQSSVIVLDDFNDSYSQVRAAYYYLRYAESYPFELVLIGFNKAILVHESRFAAAESYILSCLLDDLDAAGILCKLVRTDANQRSRNFFVRTREPSDLETHYGVRFMGDQFYKPSR